MSCHANHLVLIIKKKKKKTKNKKYQGSTSTDKTMASFSNHNTPRVPTDENIPSVGETLWTQIITHLPLQERDEVKRILGRSIINDNNSLWQELSALKSILDDYREQLHNEQMQDDATAQQNSFEQQEKLRRKQQRTKQQKQKIQQQQEAQLSNPTHSRKVPTLSLSAGPQQMFLEGQIRMFVENLSTLNTTTIEALSTPRERSLVDAIVSNSNSNDPVGSSSRIEKDSRNQSRTQRKHRSGQSSKKKTATQGRRRRTESSPEKSTTSRREPRENNTPSKSKTATTTPIKSKHRPGTAPEDRKSSEERRQKTRNCSSTTTTSSTASSSASSSTSSRPSSRESIISTSSVSNNVSLSKINRGVQFFAKKIVL